MILVDSNVWIYYLDSGLKEHRKVREALPRLLAEEDVLLPAVVQIEVVHYITGQLKERGPEVVDAFLAFPGEAEPLTDEVVNEAAQLLLKHRGAGIGGRDAALLVHARRRGALLLTADRSLARAANALGVRTKNPAG